jgi:hypothetical protein|tara:strand:- start:589 stop:816 length:228 start_codon:yes stop_codon:yes gene_type:complete
MVDKFTTDREKNRKRMKDEYPYRGISDPKYKKDKRKLFMENGNGWWYLQGVIPSDEIGQNKTDNEKQTQESVKTL